ncbi:unnamed protein product [Prunus armeniaca]
MEEQQKRNSSKGTYYKSTSFSIHLVEVKSEEDTSFGGKRNYSGRNGKVETSHELQGPYKATKGPEAAIIHMRMLLQKAIETPHKLPKPEELKGRQYCKWHNSWNHSTNSCVVFRDVIQEGIISEQNRGKLTTEASSSRGRRVTRETNQRPKATISAGVMLCIKCKCESELEVTLNRQNQPTPSVFDRIGTSYQQSSVPATSKDRARQKDYLRPTQCSRRMTQHPKKEIPIKMPGNDKPLATIIEGRWYSVRKSGRPTLELTRTQKRMIQRQYFDL